MSFHCKIDEKKKRDGLLARATSMGSPRVLWVPVSVWVSPGTPVSPQVSKTCASGSLACLSCPSVNGWPCNEMASCPGWDPPWHPELQEEALAICALELE